jgi:hypothetical protein
MFIVWLLIGAAAGFILGMLYYKNNEKKAEELVKNLAAAKEKAEAELEKLKSKG